MKDLEIRISCQEAQKFHRSTGAPSTRMELSSWSPPRCSSCPTWRQSHRSPFSTPLPLSKVGFHLLADSPESWYFRNLYDLSVENSRWTIPYWRGWDIPPSTWRERPSWCPPGGRAAVSSRTQTSTGLLCWRTRHHVKTRKQNFNLLLSVSSHKDVVLGGLLLQEQRDTNPGLLHQVLLDQHSQWQIYSSSIKVKTTITT